MLRMAVGHSDGLEPLEAIAVAIEQCRASRDDAVNTASRLETTAHAGSPQISEAVADRLVAPGARRDGTEFGLQAYGDVELKGKRLTRTYRLTDGPPVRTNGRR